MSGTAVARAPSPALPSAAVIRALVAGVVLAGLGVTTSATEVVVLAVPLLLYVVVAEALRPPGEIVVEVSCHEDAAADGMVGLTVSVPDAPAGALLVSSTPGTVGARTPEPWPPALATPACEPITSPLRLVRWGQVSLGDVTYAVGDLLGGWRAVGTASGPTLVSRPPARDLLIESVVRQPTGAVGRHPSARRGDGSEMADIRPWAPGDSPRRINWRAFARTGIHHVNTMRAEREASVLIALDSRIFVRAAGGADTIDVACEAASALTHHFTRRGDRVAVADLGGRIPLVPFGVGRRQAARVLDTLAGLDRNARPSVHPLLPPVRPGTHVYVLSPLLDAVTVETVLRLVSLGCPVACVDVLTAVIGEGAASEEALALRLRALERQPTVEALTDRGVPVVVWASPTSLAHLLRVQGSRPGAGR
ncbi:MAG: DUF58 domain-containing protein [Propionibacteriaceae bacterium]|nr:DUF58 domain-containing protein [Propionibacteriaceae bacterium]